MEEKRKKILANRVYSDTTLKRWKKEDLIEQIRILEHNWSCAEESYNNSVKNSEKIFAEQKAEIERLTEELEEKNTHEEKLNSMIDNLRDDNAELQKQVDELKFFEKKYKDLAKKYMADTKTADFIQHHAVKDTAKDICKMIKRHNKDCQINIERLIISIEARYDIEVE